MLNKNFTTAALVIYGIVGLGVVTSTVLGAPEPEQQQKQFSYLGNVTVETQRGLVVTKYYLSSFQAIWTQAAADCVSSFGRNGNTVSIETEEENMLLNDFVGGSNAGTGLTLWTSGLYEIDDGLWRWSGNPDYSFAEYSNWCEDGGPVNPNGRQRVGLHLSVVDNRATSCLVSGDDSYLERFICEVNL